MLSVAELRKIDAIGTELLLPPGSLLTREGTTGRECFVILCGQAEVSVDDRQIATAGAGDIVGEMALLASRPRTATVRAASSVRVLVFQRAEFAELLRVSPEVKRVVLTSVAERDETLASMRLALTRA